MPNSALEELPGLGFNGFGALGSTFAAQQPQEFPATPVAAQVAQTNPNSIRGGTYGALGEELPVAVGDGSVNRRPPSRGSAPLIPGGTSDREQWSDGSSAAQRLLTPAPIIDRTPIVIGGNLTLNYLASCFRNCTYGLRYQFVDVLSELLEHDPHARGVTRQRVLAVACAKLQVLPAKLPDGHPLYEKAQSIANQVDAMLRAIPRWSQSLFALAWGIITGLSAAEIEWSLTDMWRPKALHSIHSRRLNYSNPTTWDLHVWDQGLVGPGMQYMGPTTGLYGLRMADFPGKFIIHAPTLSGEYPTRDGEGRFIASYMMIKRMVARAVAQDFERSVRPLIVGYFSRDEEKDTPVPASTLDIQRLDAATKALGLGSLNSATLPDACKIEILKGASTMDAEKFLLFLDGQMSKGVLGQDYTTQPGKTGARSASEVAERGTLKLSSYDAAAICDSLERDLIYWIVRLNWPGCETLLCPRLALNVNEDLSAKELLDLAVKAAQVSIPWSKKDIAERGGMKLVDKNEKDDEPIKLVAASPAPGPDGDPPDGGGDDDKETETDDAAGAAANDATDQAAQ
jgi:phage gp29-like protein